MTPDDQTLISWVRDDFAADLASVERVTSGADENAATWRGVAADGGAYAIKLTSGGSAAGLVVPAYLVRHGVRGVPAPVPATDGRVYTERGGKRLSVVPWVGDRKAVGAMSEARWRAYGALLATVHATPIGPDVAAVLPVDTYRHDRWAGVVRTLDEARVPGDEIGRATVEKWREVSHAANALLRAADELGAELRARGTPGVICHADPHLANALLGAGDELWLIDWDDAMLAPPELDLMLLLGGMGDIGPVTAEELSWLFAGYGPVDPDAELVAYFRCRRALEDAAGWASQALDAGRWTPDERAHALRVVGFVTGPDGLVTLAMAALRELGRVGA